MYFNIDQKQYWVESNGEGIPVLLLHGFTGSSQTWGALSNSLQVDYKVITVDLPGHGKTKINKPTRMEEICEDLLTILNKMKIEKTHLIGYSMGGRTALSFAVLYPNRVASLTLESASPGLEESHEQLARQAKDEVLANKLEDEGIVGFVNYWEKIPLFASQHSLPNYVRKRIREERTNQTSQGLAASLRGMGTGRQPSWWQKLPTLPIPVLLVVGELDEKFVEIARLMNDYLKYSDLRIISNTGHAVHVEQTRIFGTIVNEFIKAH
ncbi:2-succinyl-6-hydroxy-2,4-cyclohexadiene-1-carboxylate synthase [Aquibacillus saliphilus]|uniref:2-succinyl-6-hydroxy-2, 4-cyclohexadiene-1-carboxylate synthase n=1 Tax=Aquibacillus saliphilus TaxID=1909422 RepID=UPI001CEFB1FA